MSAFTNIDTDMAEFGDVVSQELADLFRTNADYLSKIIPVGHIVPIMTNIPGVETPDSNVWQECDGSEITNVNSPLRSTGGSSRYTPNMVDRYIKVGTTAQSGNTGGSHSVSFSHNHGGWTGDHESPADADPSTTLFNVAASHRHQILTDLAGPLNWEPPYFVVKFFMKIT
jgi:hypothetical protein